MVTALLFIVHNASNDCRSERCPKAVTTKLHPIIEAVLLQTILKYHMCTQLRLLPASVDVNWSIDTGRLIYVTV